MKTHVIENGVVTNTIMASVEEAQVAYPDAVCIDGTAGAIGWMLNGGVLLPPPDLRDIDTLKHAKNEEINASRQAATYTSFEHGGQTISSDQLSRSDIDGINGYVALNNAFPAGWPGAWKAVDNTYVILNSIDAWRSFYTSMIAAGSANFAHAQALKAALSSAITAEEVAAIAWER